MGHEYRARNPLGPAGDRERRGSQRSVTQLEGLSRLQDIEYLSISIAGQKRWSAGTLSSKRRISSDIPLVRSYRGRDVTIGTLHVVASVDNVVERLWAKLVATLLRNLAKTLLVAFFMLYLFQQLAGRHLERISQHLRLLGTEPDSNQILQLDRPTHGRWRPDELDDVVVSVNEMHRDINASHAQIMSLNAGLERRVAERTHDLALAKDEAERANAAKSEFLSRMSHELRTPLNAILGFGQLLEMDAESSTPDQQQSIKYILSTGHQLLGLVNDLLDLSRIDIGKLELNIHRVRIANLASSCVKQVMSSQFKQRNITIENMITDTGLAVQGDDLRIRQVLINLLSNAVKYNKDNGRVTVNCMIEKPGRLRIQVQDTGYGIAGDKLSLLFKAFERIDQKHGTISGVGIGLHIAKQLVEAMHGTIGVESIQGQGSTFWFDLPIAEETNESTVAPRKTIPSISQTNSRFVVLYIEDNTVNVLVVKKALQRYPDIELLTASSAEDGLTIAEEEHPDLILMDIHLPGIDGIAATTTLKGIEATKHIPVVALSADAMKADVDRALSSGCSAYLTKPIDLLALYEVIDKLRPVEKCE